MQHNLFQATAKSLGFELPQGDQLFCDISFSWSYQRCGLVGPNGVGKSTLAKILSGELTPSAGDLKVSQSVTYLPQMEAPPSMTTALYLAELWESAGADPQLWGPLLSDISLEAELAHLSGGQWMRVRIAKALAQEQGLLILDEPTNNLDRQGREVILNFVRNYNSALLVISHDRELLNIVDGIWELSSQGLSSYGGGYEFYAEAKKQEREVLKNKISEARREKKKKEREHQEKILSQEKRLRAGQKVADSGSLPRILVGGRKRRAQETLGKINKNEQERADQAQQDLKNLVEQQKAENQFHILMSETSVPEGKLVFECAGFNLKYKSAEHFLWENSVDISVRGPQRLAITGPNGAGKSSFVKYLLGQLSSESIEVRGHCRLGSIPVAVLDQNYSLLNLEDSVLDNVMQTSRYDLTETRNLLARFEFFKDKVHQKVHLLSGGEKLKASLAKIFLMQPVPQFIILDEPTNNLDIESLEVLEETLQSFSGALLVISHDEEFLGKIEIKEVLYLA